MDDPLLVDEEMTGLAVRARAGDEDAFRELVARCYPNVHRWALGRVADPDDADDITQDVLLRLYRTLDRFRGDARVTTWLYQVTRNVAIDHQRRRARYRRAAIRHHDTVEHQPAAPTPLEAVERDEIMVTVRAAFTALPERQREIFDLVDLQGYTPTAAADLLDLNPGTVRAHLFRARRAVRRAILAAEPDRTKDASP